MLEVCKSIDSSSELKFATSSISFLDNLFLGNRDALVKIVNYNIHCSKALEILIHWLLSIIMALVQVRVVRLVDKD